MKILITGFEPFGGADRNPSLEVLRRLPPRIAGAEIARLELPVSFARSAALLTDAIRRLRPDAVLSLGLAGGRAAITPERVAIDLDDARMPDNDGAMPVDRPIVEGAPAAYFSTLPVKAMAEAIRAEGIPAGVSYTAGTYVCNHVMYTALRLAATEFPAMRAGFMHLPYMDGQAEGQPSLPLQTLIRAAETAIRVIAEER